MSDDATIPETSTGERLRLRTDGASRGNPGPAAAGVVVESDEGETLYSIGVYLGEMPNNQAEYRALIMGLRAVAEFQPSAVDVFMDSELVVRQMTGAYRVRDAILQQLYREAKALVQALPRVTFTHVRRAENALADQLANQALDRHKHATRQRSG
ncbi:MAG TPA: ribonuclease HI family protein [Ktedonobacterales bacterium]|nr:ribonuclease HI family protein [Ktedonobacterales bacterium]